MIGAKDRMARLVAAIPWIVAQDGAAVDEIAERFDYPREILLNDLQDVVFYVGVPPYTPDTLIEVTIDDDMVWISYADWFSRPMKLAGGELLALLTAGEAALSFDRQDEAGALARGLAKLRLATGSDGTIDVEISSADRTFLPDLRAAADAAECVEIDYYSFARNSRSARRIEPSRFFVVEGNWYVGGFCHLAAGDRIFRVDRIAGLERTDKPFSRSPQNDTDDGSVQMFTIDDAPRATLEMPADRIRVLDSLPIDQLSAAVDGRVKVTLPVSSVRWLEHLLTRVGPGVQLIEYDLEANSNEPALSVAGRAASVCLLYTSPSPRDKRQSRMPSSA